MARTNTELQDEFENRNEGAEDEEPGNQGATTTHTFPSKTVSKKPTTKVPISKAGGRVLPTRKFVNKHSGSKVVRSKAKNRTGKKWKAGGGKTPPTIHQKMKSFGGMY